MNDKKNHILYEAKFIYIYFKACHERHKEQCT